METARKFFAPGTVFACLWTEPVGETSSFTPEDNRKHVSRVFLGGRAYTNIQRFVVIHPRFEQHLSICCPIKTYGRRGTSKFQDPKAHHQHSIIYSDEQLLKRETSGKEYDKVPIHMTPTDPSIVLDERSRLNFGKPTPVDHNLRMRSIGRIKGDHLQRLLRYFDEVNNTDYRKGLPGGDNLSHTASRHRTSAYKSSQPTLTEPIAKEEDDNYGDSGEYIQTASRRRSSAYGSSHPGRPESIPEEEHDDRGDGRGNLSHTASMRRTSTYRSSHPGRTESIPGQEDDYYEDSGGYTIQTGPRRRSSTHKSSQPRRTEGEYPGTEHRDHATRSNRHGGYHDEDKPPRERSDTASSSPYPAGSRRPSTTVHHRSRTSEGEHPPPGYAHEGRPHGYR